MTTQTTLTFVLLLAADAALLLAGGWRKALRPAFLHALGRPAGPEEWQRSAAVWNAAARNAWVLTALAALTTLGRTLGGDRSSLAGFAASLLEIGIAVALGAGVAIVLSLPAMRLRRMAGPAYAEGEAQAPQPSDPVARAAGLVVLAALLAWPLALSSLGLGPATWLLHWPAVLIVAGSTVAIALYLGGPGSGSTLTVSLGAAGTLGALAGLTQALHGFALPSVGSITSGIMLVLGASTSALLGLVLIGLPRLDWENALGATPGRSRLARIVAVAFPAMALLTIAAVAVMVMTPVTRKVG
ncbi:MAG: hypothetical protein AB2L07_00385 [Thermoanaerobaculaceae bacterium]